MRPNRRPSTLAACLALAGLSVIHPDEARAQIPVYSTESVFAPVAPVVPGPTYVLRGTPAYPVQARRVVRYPRRYVALRPAYGGRPALSFAPYSDTYQERFEDRRPTYYVVPPRR